MTNAYATLKAIHAGAAGVSLALFLLRGAWRFASPERLAARWVKVVPHVVDTVLLAAALALAWQLGVEAARGWLWAKVAGLVVYIGLGVVALRLGRTPAVRTAAFVAALATFGYIVSVAVTKSPRGFLAWL
jgi:uncharacterized membrane protein SirB2